MKQHGHEQRLRPWVSSHTELLVEQPRARHICGRSWRLGPSFVPEPHRPLSLYDLGLSYDIVRGIPETPERIDVAPRRLKPGAHRVERDVRGTHIAPRR